MEIYAIVNVSGSRNNQNRQKQHCLDSRYQQSAFYSELSPKSPQMFIEEHNKQMKQYNQQHQASSQQKHEFRSKPSATSDVHVFASNAASNYADEFLPQVVGNSLFEFILSVFCKYFLVYFINLNILFKLYYVF